MLARQQHCWEQNVAIFCTYVCRAIMHEVGTCSLKLNLIKICASRLTRLLKYSNAFGHTQYARITMATTVAPVCRLLQEKRAFAVV